MAFFQVANCEMTRYHKYVYTEIYREASMIKLVSVSRSVCLDYFAMNKKGVL